MKHHILLTFHATKPLPADFVDLAADRIYTMDLVDKRECEGRTLTQSQVDLLDGVDHDDIPAILRRQAC